MHAVSSLVCIHAGKILLVQSNKSDHWILPGGKCEEGEEPMEALIREVQEKLSGARLVSPEYYTMVDGVSPRQRKSTRVYVYISELSPADMFPSAEIVQILWATYDETNQLKLSDLSMEILNRLRSDGYL